ncbi:MAG: hypothetical protein MK066_06460 [Crocinitomicaceae bacterium]|nr:hypothetical protein [Crocinitomicaceae bacterium]
MNSSNRELNDYLHQRLENEADENDLMVKYISAPMVNGVISIGDVAISGGLDENKIDLFVNSVNSGVSLVRLYVTGIVGVTAFS